MVSFFIPNDNPSEMICIHQFEWMLLIQHRLAITQLIISMIHLLWKAPVLHAKTKSQIEDQLLFGYVN